VRTPRAIIGAAFVIFAIVSTACTDDEGATPDDETPDQEVADQDGTDADSIEAESTGEVSVLSYNVAGLPEGFSSSNPSVNSPQLSPLLNDYDLVLLQEDWGDPDPVDYSPEVYAQYAGIDLFHDLVVADATHEFQSEPAQQPLAQDAGRPSALLADGLNRLARMPFGDVSRVAWNDCEGVIDGASDCLAFKGFSVATHELADGVDVDVYNLHGEAGGGPADQALQVADYAQLATFINEHSPGKAIILGGDTNLHTDGDHEDGAAGADGEIWNTFLAATEITDVCGALECGDEIGRIDKFAFRSSDDLRIEPLDREFAAEKFTRDDGEPMSDHEPLAVTFRWSATAT
jgi:hypothetical protein